MYNFNNKEEERIIKMIQERGLKIKSLKSISDIKGSRISLCHFHNPNRNSLRGNIIEICKNVTNGNIFELVYVGEIYEINGVINRNFIYFTGTLREVSELILDALEIE